MREIIYRNLTGSDARKHDFSIREVIMQEDFTATIERRCLYFVRERVYIEDPNNLEQLATLKNEKDIWKKRHFHILRKHDSRTGEDKLICKVAGTLYAIVEHYVFSIAFVHSFKIDLASFSYNKK